MSAVRSNSYFEDYAIGAEIAHRRGRTVMQEENARWSLQSMNTAQSHYNIESMRTYMDGRFDRPIVNAAIVIALSVGLTSSDITDNIFAEVGLDAIRISTPVFAGDTLNAVSTILATQDIENPSHSGLLRYRIATRNQAGAPVLTMERSVLIKRRSHWAERDLAFASRFWSNQTRSDVSPERQARA